MYICLVATILIPIIRIIPTGVTQVAMKKKTAHEIAVAAKNPAKKRKNPHPAKNPTNRNAAAAKKRKKAIPNKSFQPRAINAGNPL